jgi:hypothetical protein
MIAPNMREEAYRLNFVGKNQEKGWILLLPRSGPTIQLPHLLICALGKDFRGIANRKKRMAARAGHKII